MCIGTTKRAATCTAPATRTVQGYEFDEHLEFNDDAIFILALLRHQGIVYFRFDGLTTLEAICQLAAASKGGVAKGGHFDVLKCGHNAWVIESGQFEIDLIG